MTTNISTARPLDRITRITAEVRARRNPGLIAPREDQFADLPIPIDG